MTKKDRRKQRPPKVSTAAADIRHSTAEADQAMLPAAHTVPNGESDAALVARALLGDALGFEELVRRHADSLYRTAWRYTGSREEAEDAVAETFCRAYDRLREIRGISNVGPWLRTIATNLCLDGYRKRAYRGERIKDYAAEASVTSAEPSPERRALDAEAARELDRALRQLSPRQRAAFVLFEIEGLDIRQVAREMGCSEGTVKAQLHRARQRLRDLMSHYLA